MGPDRFVGKMEILVRCRLRPRDGPPAQEDEFGEEAAEEVPTVLTSERRLLEVPDDVETTEV